MVPPWQQDKSGYLSQDTIAAVSSALGGAIALIRLSGPKCAYILSALTGSNTTTPEPKKLTRQILKAVQSQQILDDAMVVYFRAPQSFTGEDVVEFQIHGSAQVASQLMEELLKLGARPALPGEFSFRAVRNGKMSINQAEAIADLIASKNQDAVTLALEKMSGTQNRFLEIIGEQLRKLVSLCEVGIDFSDQDVAELSLGRLKGQIKPIQNKLTQLEQSYVRGSKIQEGISVAFVGLPNSGKSSFFNALLGEDRSIVSDVPGTTRDVVREAINLRGSRVQVTLRLEDTAGLRDSADVVEKIGIERTLRAVSNAQLILFVVDSLNPKWEALQSIWAQIGGPSTRAVGILTKIDLCSTQQLEKVEKDCASFSIKNWVRVSSITHEGVTEGAQTIADVCENWVARSPEEVVLTRLEQVHTVQNALRDLNRALESWELDLLAADLRQALGSLAPLIGDTLPDDILGRIFSQFCIGK